MMKYQGCEIRRLGIRLRKTAMATLAALLPMTTLTATAQELVDADDGAMELATAVEGQNYMIVTANPDASAAGAEIFEKWRYRRGCNDCRASGARAG